MPTCGLKQGELRLGGNAFVGARLRDQEVDAVGQPWRGRRLLAHQMQVLARADAEASRDGEGDEQGQPGMRHGRGEHGGREEVCPKAAWETLQRGPPDPPFGRLYPAKALARWLHRRLWSQGTMRSQLFVMLIGTILLSPVALAATDDAAFFVPEGTTLVVANGILTLQGDLRVEGALMAPAGMSLVIDTPGSVVVEGLLQAGHGAPGVRGGDLVVRAGRLAVGPDATLGAGAGGAGLAVENIAGVARGGDGAAGGDLRILAAVIELDGVLSPGAGGRGGDALGHEAFGGAGASPGHLLVNGEAQESSALTQGGPVPQSFTCIATDIQPPQVVMGAPGGNACADGTPGVNGITGADGQDDETLIDKGTRPDCADFVPGWQDLDGEQGQDGTLGLAGGPAVAVGGRGGDAITSSMMAGNGGGAYARGGNGGAGGHGGMGGHAKGSGYGCRGGDGGNGGNGGPGTATAGAQGLNPLNCSKNGHSGSATSIGGPGGAGGWGGGGGGGLTPSHNGPSGSSGSGGYAGYNLSSVPAEIPCFAPDAPTLVATDDLLTCDAIRLAITQPAFNGNSAITHYRLYRGMGPGNLSYIGDVAYVAPVTLALDGGRVINQTYYYRAQAVTAVGTSPDSWMDSATPNCLTAVPDLGDIGIIIDPSTTAPLLVAMPSGGPSATLTIHEPTTILGNPLTYDIYRGPTNGGEAPLAMGVDYNGSTTTFVDHTVLPLTPYWYYVVLHTDQDVSPPSNHMLVTTPLLLQGGGGSGGAQHTLYKGGSATTRTCSAVPIDVVYVFAGGSFALDVKYGEGTGLARTDDPAFCAATDDASVRYGNEGRSALVERQLGTSEPCDEDDAQRSQDGGWVVTRSCKLANGDGESHRVVLGKGPDATRWTYTHDVSVSHADGSRDVWRFVGSIAKTVDL